MEEEGKKSRTESMSEGQFQLPPGQEFWSVQCYAGVDKDGKRLWWEAPIYLPLGTPWQNVLRHDELRMAVRAVCHMRDKKKE